MKPKVLVIVGSTASGKSALAVRLAKKFNGEVISADSRQVYKGLNVGTGKITKKEMSGIPHHLLDVADPKKPFSVSDYKELTEKSIRYIVYKDKLPIIVGGAGFYIDAITGRATLPEVPPNKKLRRVLEKKSKEELFKILKKKDPKRAEIIDKDNKVRLVRALEIVEALGKVPEIKNNKINNRKYIFIGLRPEQKELERRIYKRLIERLPGMIREAKSLRRKGLSIKRMEALGLEYRYLARFLQNKITKEEFVTQLFAEIKKYSKRQWVWFKRNKEIEWFEPNEFKEIAKYASISLKGD
ncbi:tRNA (adenosine(37)-N6)-dimethylallyltransferase MiaA [Candidatus Parcubacteria bacterium]|nr:tRNA (adenosine(37)-N6)-dimethylallyltransferase MiaA [Candidatus Parcubacteria bacterium]